MEKAGISTAVLSLTAPGVEIVAKDARPKFSREANEYAARIRNAAPHKFGFFATAPSTLNTAAALEEIACALDVLHADGIILLTRYGEGNFYLGNELFRPIGRC